MSSGDIDNIEYSETKWHLFNMDNPDAMNFVRSVYHVDTQYDIPYLGGASLSGFTVYIDREFNRYWNHVDTAQFIAVHERFEWWIIHNLGLTYTSSHRWANTAE